MANRPGTFKKGDPRINRKGRPKSFSALRTLALQIAHEVALRDEKPIIVSGRKATVAEMILRSWATSKNTKLQMAFIEVAFGKVPTAIDLDVTIFDVSKWKATRAERLRKAAQRDDATD